MYENLFSEIIIEGLTFKNRLIMAPLYLGYAGEGGTVSNMLLEHYRLMAASGVAMVVVENATVDHPGGSGSNRTLRADTDTNLDGLKRLAEVIRRAGARACLQINHAGRFAHAAEEPLAPSAVPKPSLGRSCTHSSGPVRRPLAPSWLAVTANTLCRVVPRCGLAWARGFFMTSGAAWLVARWRSAGSRPTFPPRRLSSRGFRLWTGWAMVSSDSCAGH